ncbi:hypothetical protein H9657_02115 [Cellulomonas sp. Sa3CUA2]|uniref:GNAT family N-acetyltransferase n=1 Tax=Cellulomonas avistercoris TaxID=2762242 RepID=A0ABR8Q9H5_9CELL|nr:hypothetical protein [Cellulomonas avistercoris]MBD7917077.1 hypothetical protein [Cellulomonas avistercoris]
MATDARGGPSADAARVRGAAAAVGSTGETSTASRRRAEGAVVRCPDPSVADLGVLLSSRGWVAAAPEEWRWRAAGTVHARVLTSRDGGLCLVLGDTGPGDWSGHVDVTTLAARLPDVERHRAGCALPAWAVTDSLLVDAGIGAGRAGSRWRGWTVVRDLDDVLTLTTRTGPLAARRPTITFTPRPARDVVRSPQAVGLRLDGHPARTFWTHRLRALASRLQGTGLRSPTCATSPSTSTRRGTCTACSTRAAGGPSPARATAGGAGGTRCSPS